jgi:hypothetical protein
MRGTELTMIYRLAFMISQRFFSAVLVIIAGFIDQFHYFFQLTNDFKAVVFLT